MLLVPLGPEVGVDLVDARPQHHVAADLACLHEAKPDIDELVEVQRQRVAVVTADLIVVVIGASILKRPPLPS